ncbi:MAG: bifunctional phosphopantothenoylcysteine decarboxylase/phosphopantothenate--cysteine ligase CoaBC [Acidimicrobiales bacterium]
MSGEHERDATRALEGRRVVLGVTGGIAAYKAAEICRRLVDAGAWVSPVMTEAAQRFLGETTLSALASEPVRSKLWGAGDPIPHTLLGQRADLVLVAPATARIIGVYAAGISSDLLSATLLATRAPVLMCPAMHTEMWENPAVADNVATLTRRGVHFVGPGVGRLAGGDLGAGRMAEPDEIVRAAARLLAASAPLAGLSAVVTAGGTREPIDPVRYVGNRSSGRQGYAIAAELAARGAKVRLVTTVSSTLQAPAGVETVEVETALEMLAAVQAELGLVPEAAVDGPAANSPAVLGPPAGGTAAGGPPAGGGADLLVMTAAVADFRPARPAGEKLKKAHGIPAVELVANPDILATIGEARRAGRAGEPACGPVLVGFAAETVRPGGPTLIELAQGKLTSKRADLIVANDVSLPSVGFGHATNAVVIVDGAGRVAEVPLSSKEAVAAAVVDAAQTLLAEMGRLRSSGRPDLQHDSTTPRKKENS